MLTERRGLWSCRLEGAGGGSWAQPGLRRSSCSAASGRPSARAGGSSGPEAALCLPSTPRPSHPHPHRTPVPACQSQSSCPLLTLVPWAGLGVHSPLLTLAPWAGLAWADAAPARPCPPEGLLWGPPGARRRALPASPTVMRRGLQLRATLALGHHAVLPLFLLRFQGSLLRG